MIRQICLLFLFLGIPIQQRTPLPTSRAARVSITGTVVRGGTNEPIGSVRITLRPSGVSVVTDMGGKFRIHAVPGRCTLTAEREGFVLQLDAAHGGPERGDALTRDEGQQTFPILTKVIRLCSTEERRVPQKHRLYALLRVSMPAV